MKEERRNEIAMRMVLARINEEGMPLKSDMSEELQRSAKKLSISVEELKEFARPILQEMIDKNFGKK